MMKKKNQGRLPPKLNQTIFTIFRYVWLVCLGVGMTAGFGCRARREATPPREFMALGTLASIRTGADESVAPETVEQQVLAVFAEVEGRLSIYRPDSEISRLNGAGTNPVAISPATRVILEKAIQYGELSGGSFDITIGPLVRAWGFSGGKVPQGLPDEETLQATRKRVGFRLIDLESDRVALRVPGLFIDLGGIAKGYAVDCAWERVRGVGARNALINLGGNMRAMGQATSERLWRVGVRNPFDGTQILGQLELAPGQAVATSGNYERFVTIEGRRYTHIIDPRTARPVEGMAGVTVLAPTAMEADAWSTILFILGIEAGGAVLADHPGIEALWVPDRDPPGIWVTPGFAKVFCPLPEWRGGLQQISLPNGSDTRRSIHSRHEHSGAIGAVPGINP